MLQDKELTTSKEKTNWQKLIRAGKVLTTLLIFSYIYKTFSTEQKGIGDVGKVLTTVLAGNNIGTFLLTFLMVPLNWALESLKWQKLAGKVVKLSFREALRSTLTGLAVGVAAPAQVGDTAGRVASLKADNRLETIGAAVVSNGVQFYVSVVAGAFGWLYFGESLKLSALGANLLSIVIFVVLSGGVLVVVARKRILNYNPEKDWQKKLHSYFRIIGAYTGMDLLLALVLGAARYMVFLTQFVLTLSLFDFPLDYLTLSACVTLIFLAKTLIPAVNVLGDLGLREFTALFVFRQFGLPPEQIIAATFLIWILNVLGPILIGMYLIWKYKWKT
ncbi:hypothetical protein DYBT9275_05792 [Dyadobacter sp. CECT 9275]|uniref:Uncharacterized protein n=1 Tax=Dyadobacter helix TaxID=2822344 RepID=A0A916JI44_9BACT|nr:lysylphosphatidylglycerol synthase domain-containing protein [Dyadobacter sp. CECT 9275]CAG5017535.1 hypothetical protein DYBT9275_05792 [Dyadobacter sp. CECT 9275]